MVRELSGMDRVAWNMVEHALSRTRCPRLQNIHLCFLTRATGPMRAEVAERLPELASRGFLEIVDIGKL
jgi:hypothetical protein